MTATTTRPKPPARVKCPHCTYVVDNAGSLPAHIAMAHKDVPMDVVAPKRPASPPYVANGEQLADRVVAPKRSARNGSTPHTPAAPAADPSGPGAATLAEAVSRG